MNSYVSFYFNYLSTREVSTVSLSCSDSNSFFLYIGPDLDFLYAFDWTAKSGFAQFFARKI